MTDLSPITEKIENGGSDPQGVLTADEFNLILQALKECQGGIKCIIRNGVEYKPDKDGIVKMTILSDSELPTVRLQTTDNRTNIISTDGTVKLHLRYTSVYTRDGISEDTGHDGILVIQRKTATDTEWLNVATITVTPQPWDDENAYAEFDISAYLLDGDQQLRLVVTDKELNVSSAYLTFNSVVKTRLAVDFISNWQNAVPGGDGASTTLSYVLYGAVEKELHLVISGKTTAGAPATREIVLNNATIAGYTGTSNPFHYILQDIASEACKVLSVHGIHTIEAWLQTTVDSSIQSEHIFSQIFVLADSTDRKPYLILQKIADKVTNYVTGDILQYAVYNPVQGAALPLEFSIGNYAGDTIYLNYSTQALPGVQYTLHNTVEVEGDSTPEITTYLRVTSDGADMLTDSIGASIRAILVDNSENFAPTAGADFFLNPKTRNNTEDNPAVILNAAQNNAVIGSTFEGFGFVNDGWVTDASGQRCLRVLAGQALTINYESFQAFIDAGQKYGNQKASVTIEFDMAIRNVTNETDPILRICSYLAADNLPLGLEMKPLEGVFMTRSQRTSGQQNFAWQEGKRTHIAINCYYNLGSAAANETQVSYVRIFINGNIEREFLFDHNRSNEFWQNDANGTPSSLGIRLGQDGADIDIYSLLVYQKGLSSQEIQQNRASSLPTAAEKLAFRAENDLLQDGAISYAKAAAKYNVMVWHGYNVSGHNEDTKTDKKGDLYIQIRGADGTIDRAHSGNLTDMTQKGQGSTAKLYYEWNPQFQWKGDTGSFVDLDGVDHGQKYQLIDGVPWAKKLVGKINYASSMQSHKQGACDLYNDLYRRIVTDWSVPTVEGFEDTRVTVIERPFLYFVQTPDDAQPVFQGLITFGPGKADKPTWGYDKKVFPDMAMLEGSDNNFPLTDCRVPWTDDAVRYNAEEEYFEYNGEGNLDFDLGRVHDDVDATGGEIEVPDEDLIEYYKAAWNWNFRWNCLITFYDGTLEDLKADKTVNTKLAYWVTKSSDTARQFDLFRTDYLGKDASNNDILEWVPAGVTKQNGVWSSVNLMDETPVANTSLWADMNADFIAARATEWKAKAGDYFSVRSLQFHQMFIKLLAGTDNRSKNTYYALDPVTHKIHLHADDLDTILKTNNTGWQLKPYWLEEHDTDAAGNTYWEGQYNVLFDLVEKAYADALPQMMKTILGEMSALVGAGSKDKYGNIIPQTPEGCIQKYFFWIQEYFPAVAYNETARIRYETAQLAVAKGEFAAPSGINPITQSLGSQLESERQYIKRRMIYLSSFAAYGEFDAGSATGALSIRGMKTTDGGDAPMVLKIKNHQWLYPTGATGQSLVNPHIRLAPGGRLVDAAGQPYGDEGYDFNIGTIVGDTSCKLSGINYMSSIGNVADLSVNPSYSFTVSGERLTEFIAEPAEGKEAQFRPSSLLVTAPHLRRFSVKGCALIGGELSLTAQTRLESVDIRDTGFVGVVLPETETLLSAHLNGNLAELTLKNTRNLADLTLQDCSYLTQLQFLENHGSFDTLAFLNTCYTSRAPISIFSAVGIAWENMQASVLEWLANIASSTVTGSIQVSGTTSAVTFEMKIRMLEKWGNVDTGADGLLVTYPLREVTNALIFGPDILRSIGNYDFGVKPATAGGVSTTYGNNFTGISWEISSNIYASVDPDSGLVSLKALGNELEDGSGPTATLTCRIHLLDGSTVTAQKILKLYNRSARVGDMVFADGDWSDEYDGTRTVIGVCFFVDKTTGLRLMVSTKNAPKTYSIWGLFPAHADVSESYEVPDVVLESGYDAYDTPMANNTTQGILATAEGGSTSYISDATYRDESENGVDGFRVMPAGSAQDTLGYFTLKQDFHGWKTGDRIPYGLYYTLILIDHRDTVLSELGLDIPAASATETEAENLEALIDKIMLENNGESKYSQFYFPAASRAHAYEPTVTRAGETLADRFKAGNWWLPSAGELARLYWYHSKGYDGADFAIFTKAVVAGVFSRFTAGSHWSSLGDSRFVAWYVSFGSGGTGSVGRYHSCIVRPVAAF